MTNVQPKKNKDTMKQTKTMKQTRTMKLIRRREPGMYETRGEWAARMMDNASRVGVAVMAVTLPVLAVVHKFDEWCFHVFLCLLDWHFKWEVLSSVLSKIIMIILFHIMFFYVMLYQHINFLALLSPIKGGGRRVTNASNWKTARGDRRFGWFPLGLWRRERDSNPWTPKRGQRFSRPPRSTTPASLRVASAVPSVR